MEASTTLTRGRPDGEGKIRRGWRLTKVAWTLVRHDRTMLLLAFAGIGGSIAIWILLLLLGGFFSSGHRSSHLGLLVLLAFYPTILVSLFFNVALACAASAALDDERMSAGEAVRMAWGKRGRIALWALITAAVGMIISEIASRLPGGGRIVGWLAGAAWGLATIFVVPILAMEGIGAVDAVKRSAATVKSRWGEGLTGDVAIGAWGVVVSVPLAVFLVIGIAVGRRSPGPGLAIVATALIALVLISTVLAATRQVFAVALYRFAIGAPIGGFAPGDLENPFTGSTENKKRKSWILRIGVPILALFAILFILVAIFGHHRRGEAPVDTGARGEFSLYHAVGNAPHLPIGTPVLLRGRQVGEVVGTTREDGTVYNRFQVDPRFSPEMRPGRGHVSLRGSEKVICIGSGAECPRHLPRAPAGRPAAPGARSA